MLRHELSRCLPLLQSSLQKACTTSFLGSASNAVQLQGLSTSQSPQASAKPFSFTPPGRNHLFVPGPVNIHDRVLRAMNVPGQNHRDPWFAEFYKEVLEDSKFVFQTKEATPFIFPSTGTGGWESALQNTLSPGDKVVTFRYGQFSHLWIDMQQRMGLDVHAVDVPWGEGVHEDKLEQILKQDTGKKIKAVCVVHNETTTGVTSDVKGCRDAMTRANHPALLLVDGVSSIGALDFRMDDWGVDVAVTGSQKAMSLPTGLAYVAASKKALEAHKTAQLKRCFFDWADYLKSNPVGSTPYTPSLSLLYGTKESIAMLKEEGFDNVVARHHRLAEGVRHAVAGWGLKTLCKEDRWKSDSLTVVETPGVDSNKIVKAAFAKYDLSLGVGLSKINGKVFRIGHLGNMNELMLAGALMGAEMSMRDAGMDIVPGSGVSRAVDYWQKTTPVIPTRESLMA
eukprot:CAMPEP_0202339556 /NCGR_PEP_ID=MMETSP1126-20121109/1365_1 /ASSEMBLY_ACC=CAM_ASM_000457 /TAXON_ID=3047 /ORGANISM="Dunaliella tertiolecta, Strain CCMP1320" /LENGTH=452 /DNA_ID=CAMNT_0048930119 /DNA_START=317 /DNA_END=1675 /DNA_ORIENTATION=+